MNNKFLIVGNQYTYIAALGKGPKAYMGKYLGFQVEGGVTILGFEYETRKGDNKVIYLTNNQFYGAEPVDVTAEANTSPSKEETTAKATATETANTPKRRGRPPRDPDAAKATATATTGDAPRKRGRPPRDPNATKEVKPTVTATTDVSGAPAPRKRGRPPRVKPEMHAIPPSIPTPSTVTEVEEIEESTSASADSQENVKEVVAAVPPTDDTETTSAAVVTADASSVSDEEEVVPARTRNAPSAMPKRPVSNLARASNVPDEIEGDL